MATKHKSFLPLLGGIIIGVGLTLLVQYGIRHFQNNDGSNLETFTQVTETYKCHDFYIMQVLPDGKALAYADLPLIGEVVLIEPIKGVVYYDRLELNIPKGKKAMMGGIYTYVAQDETTKTVPYIVFR